MADLPPVFSILGQPRYSTLCDRRGDQHRHVQRVTIVGDLPVGIDGKQSEAIKGDASEYNRRQAVTA